MFKKYFIYMMAKPAILYFLLAVFIFAIGYATTLLLGADNVLEEISELLLNKFYKIDVEFSN